MFYGTIWTCLSRMRTLSQLTGIGMGQAEQVSAGVQVSEGTDAQAVGRVELCLQELTTHLSHLH